MRKDWFLIRAILMDGVDSGLSEWSGKEVREHLVLCLDAKYVSMPKILLDRFPDTTYGLAVTALGSEVAERLACFDDLEAVIEELDALDLGAPSDLLFSLLRERALKRLGRVEPPPAKRRAKRG